MSRIFISLYHRSRIFSPMIRQGHGKNPPINWQRDHPRLKSQTNILIYAYIFNLHQCLKFFDSHLFWPPPPPHTHTPTPTPPHPTPPHPRHAHLHAHKLRLPLDILVIEIVWSFHLNHVFVIYQNHTHPVRSKDQHVKCFMREGPSVMIPCHGAVGRRSGHSYIN